MDKTRSANEAPHACLLQDLVHIQGCAGKKQETKVPSYERSTSWKDKDGSEK